MGLWPSFLTDTLRIAKKIEKATDTFTDLVSYFNEKIEELVAQFKKITKNLFWQIPLLCIAYCIADKVGISIFALGAASPLLVSYLGDYWNDYFCAPAHQGAEDVMSMLTTLALTCVMPKSASTSMIAETILRRVGNFSKAEEGFRGLFSSLIGASEKIVNCVAY
jgi:ABC-type proline/glycine betaine transport system permease subunit